jgi:hypothetical protein
VIGLLAGRRSKIRIILAASFRANAALGKVGAVFFYSKTGRLQKITNDFTFRSSGTGRVGQQLTIAIWKRNLETARFNSAKTV